MFRPTLRLYHLSFGFLSLAALVVQLHASIEYAADFFSYFTILSNVAAMCLFLYFGVATEKQITKRKKLDTFRAAIVTYMGITGIVYWTILVHGPALAAYPWINIVAHAIMPIAVVIEWLLLPPVAKIKLKNALLFLLFPILYVIYTEIRGPIVGWYPYFFLNPERVTYEHMAGYIIGILMLTLVVSGIILTLGNKLQKSPKKR